MHNANAGRLKKNVSALENCYIVKRSFFFFFFFFSKKGLLLFIIIIIISLFQEDIFGTNASLTYGPRLQR